MLGFHQQPFTAVSYIIRGTQIYHWEARRAYKNSFWYFRWKAKVRLVDYSKTNWLCSVLAVWGYSSLFFCNAYPSCSAWSERSSSASHVEKGPSYWQMVSITPYQMLCGAQRGHPGCVSVKTRGNTWTVSKNRLRFDDISKEHGRNLIWHTVWQIKQKHCLQDVWSLSWQSWNQLVLHLWD